MEKKEYENTWKCKTCGKIISQDTFYEYETYHLCPCGSVAWLSYELQKKENQKKIMEEIPEEQDFCETLE